MPPQDEDVSIINRNGIEVLGIITNLVCSGYAKFGGDSGSLFAPEGNLQISGTLVTYNNVFARGGLYVDVMDFSGGPENLRGAFIRGSADSGSPTIDAAGVRFFVAGSGQILGPLEVNRFISGNGIFNNTDAASHESTGINFATVGSGYFQGPMTFAGRADCPNDNVQIAIPLRVGNVASVGLGPSRVMASGEWAAGGMVRTLDAQTAMVGADNANGATIYQYQVLSGVLGTKGGIEVEWFGHYLNNTGAPHTFAVSVAYGAAIFCTATLSGIAASVNARALSGRALINAAGSTTAQRGMLTCALDVPSTVSGVGMSGASGQAVVVTNPYLAVHTNGPPQDVQITFAHDGTDPQLRAFAYNVTTRKL